MLMSAELMGCVTWFIYFLDLLYVWYNCVKFHHCRICVTDVRTGRPSCTPDLWAARKRPILNRAKDTLMQIFQCTDIIVLTYKIWRRFQISTASSFWDFPYFEKRNAFLQTYRNSRICQQWLLFLFKYKFGRYLTQ